MPSETIPAVDQAVEALAGPDAGDGETARIESQKDVGLLHDQRNYVLVGHSGQLYARFETTREDAQFVADAVRAALPASTPQPEPAAGGWRPTRQQIARVIDPAAWRASDDRNDSRGHPVILEALDRKKLAPSLAKADAILAIAPPSASSPETPDPLQDAEPTPRRASAEPEATHGH